MLIDTKILNTWEKMFKWYQVEGTVKGQYKILFYIGILNTDDIEILNTDDKAFAERELARPRLPNPTTPPDASQH